MSALSLVSSEANAVMTVVSGMKYVPMPHSIESPPKASMLRRKSSGGLGMSDKLVKLALPRPLG